MLPHYYGLPSHSFTGHFLPVRASAITLLTTYRSLMRFLRSLHSSFTEQFYLYAVARLPSLTGVTLAKDIRPRFPYGFLLDGTTTDAVQRQYPIRGKYLLILVSLVLRAVRSSIRQPFDILSMTVF